MDANEALNAIIEVLPDIEKFDEHLNVIRTAISGEANSDASLEWEKKYNDLREKYIARFKDAANDSMRDTGSGAKDENDADAEDAEDIDIKSLDFDGASES